MHIDNQILNYLREHIEASPKEIIDFTNYSKQFIHRVLLRLVEQEFIEKNGRPPKVFYRIKDKKSIVFNESITNEDQDFLQEHFNSFNDRGEELNGKEGFLFWCNKQKLPFNKTLKEYIETRKKYLSYFEKKNFIDGTEKLKNTKGLDICIDKILYGDFYAIERFGKTKIGNLIHFGKQGQNKGLMEKICVALKEKINKLIEVENVDGIGFIPPTIKRNLQLMNYLKQSFNFSIPLLSITKVSGEIPIPQKALSKLSDRISNAKTSIIVTEKRKFNKILLIDDAIGSGATINETACKIKFKKISNHVIGLAVVGSFKGFDIIQEV